MEAALDFRSVPVLRMKVSRKFQGGSVVLGGEGSVNPQETQGFVLDLEAK